MKRKRLLLSVSVVSLAVVALGIGALTVSQNDGMIKTRAEYSDKVFSLTSSDAKITKDGEFAATSHTSPSLITFNANGLTQAGAGTVIGKFKTGGYIENITPMQNLTTISVNIKGTDANVDIGSSYVSYGFLNNVEDLGSGCTWVNDVVYEKNFGFYGEKPSFMRVTFDREVELTELVLGFSCEAETGKHASMPKNYATTENIRLVGSFNKWDFDSGIKFRTDPFDKNKFRLEHVYVEAGTEFKVFKGTMSTTVPVNTNKNDSTALGDNQGMYPADWENGESNIIVYTSKFYSIYIENNVCKIVL